MMLMLMLLLFLLFSALALPSTLANGLLLKGAVSRSDDQRHYVQNGVAEGMQRLCLWRQIL